MQYPKKAIYLTIDGVGQLPENVVGIVEVVEVSMGEHRQFVFNETTRRIHIPNHESEMLTYRVLCQIQ